MILKYPLCSKSYSWGSNKISTAAIFTLMGEGKPYTNELVTNMLAKWRFVLCRKIKQGNGDKGG